MADLTADDLLSPSGRLIPKVHFPGQSLSSIKKKLNRFVELAKTEGAATADVAEFERARAYERAFDEVYQRLIVVAADVQADEGRRAFLAQQLAAVGAERDKYAALADEMLVEVAVPTVYPVRGQSRSIPIVFTGPYRGPREAMTEAEIRRRWRP